MSPLKSAFVARSAAATYASKGIRVNIVAPGLVDTPLAAGVLRSDAGTIGVGGDYQVDEPLFADAVSGQGAEAVVTIPAGGGGYRLAAEHRPQRHLQQVYGLDLVEGATGLANAAWGP